MLKRIKTAVKLSSSPSKFYLIIRKYLLLVIFLSKPTLLGDFYLTNTNKLRKK